MTTPRAHPARGKYFGKGQELLRKKLCVTFAFRINWDAFHRMVAVGKT